MKKLIRNIILLFILLTPVFNISELLEFLNGGSVSLIAFNGLAFLKYLKDIFFGIILILGIVEAIRTDRLHYYNQPFLVFLFFCMGSMVVSAAFVPVLGVLAGLRMIFPLLLLPFLYNVMDKQFLRQIARILFFMFMLHLSLQLVQAIVLRNSMFGTNALGLSKRNPGIYIIPSSAGFFSLVCKFFVDYQLKLRSQLKKNFVFIFFLLSVFLAGSGTAVVVFLMYEAVRAVSRFDGKSQLIILGPVIVALVMLFTLLPVITSRPDIFISLATRIGIAQDAFTPQNLLFSSHFGLGTNIAKLLLVPGAQVLDSTYTALLYNVGLTGFIFYIIFVCSIIKVNIIEEHDRSRKRQFIAFLSVFLTFSFTLIVFEAFPMNLLFMISLSFFKFEHQSLLNSAPHSHEDLISS